MSVLETAESPAMEALKTEPEAEEVSGNCKHWTLYTPTYSTSTEPAVISLPGKTQCTTTRGRIA